MAETRIIKRYANRKLYDTQHSRYVTLEQISEMVRLGDDVKIIDNKSKDDLTTVTLAQIIFEEEKKQRSFMPLSAMRNIIQNGGEWIAEAQRKVQSLLPGKKVAEAVEVNPVVAGDGDGESQAERDRKGVVALREWVHHSKGTLEAWQERLRGAIGGAIEGISPFSGVNKDVKALADRIAELEAKLEKLVDDELRAPR